MTELGTLTSARRAPGDPRRTERLRERNKQEKLERIERAARLLFTQKGFDRTTTREIAHRARVGAGTLFLYAKDKRELLLRMFRTDRQHAVEATYASIPRGQGLLAEVLHTFERMLDHYAGAPDLARIFVKELMFSGGEEVGPLVLEDIDRLADLVRQAQARGEVRAEIAPLIAATNLWGVSYFALHAWLGGYFSKSTAQSLMRELLDLQIRGLREVSGGRPSSSRQRRTRRVSRS